MKRFLTRENLAILLILGAVLTRLIPHPPNFTPVLSIALFSGFLFESKWKALVVVVLAFILSNVVLGFYDIVWFVTAIIALITGFGFLMKDRHSVGWVLGFSVGASMIFFLLSNFAIWSLDLYYPMTWAGLMEAYVMAIPFYKFTLASTVFYSLILFEGHRLLNKTVSGIKPSAA